MFALWGSSSCKNFNRGLASFSRPAEGGSVTQVRFRSTKGSGRIRNALRAMRLQHMRNGIERKKRLEIHYALMEKQRKDAIERRIEGTRTTDEDVENENQKEKEINS